GLPRIGVARRAIGGCLEMGIPEPAVPAACEHHPLAGMGEIGNQGLAVLIDLRSRRYFQHRIGTVRTVAVLAHPAAAFPGLEMLLIPVIDQRVETLHGFGNHVASFAAVAAVWSAEFYEFLAPKRDAAVAAITGANKDLGLVEKFHRICQCGRNGPNGGAQCLEPRRRSDWCKITGLFRPLNDNARHAPGTI